MIKPISEKMNYQEKRTKLGKLFYSLTYNIGIKLGKHPIIVTILNYTWGILATLIGWLVFSFCIIFLRKKIIKNTPYKWMRALLLGNNWGGCSLGLVMLVADGMGSEYTSHTFKHELGHSVQNAFYGPFWLFIVAIPSGIRYLYRNSKISKGKELPDYDQIWFEGSATDIGGNVCE